MLPVKLVFVDDDPDDRELIQDGLSALAADAFLVLDSGRSFFSYLTPLKGTDLPEAVVLDLNMPEIGGMEILKQLKSEEAYQKIPVYILTTSSRPDIKQLCIKEGAAGYYTKPSSIVELNTLLNEIYNTVN
jgi:CheY-like chemotaxis protein